MFIQGKLVVYLSGEPGSPTKKDLLPTSSSFNMKLSHLGLLTSELYG